MLDGKPMDARTGDVDVRRRGMHIDAHNPGPLEKKESSADDRRVRRVDSPAGERLRRAVVVLGMAVLCLGVTGTAGAAMVSVKHSRTLCETTGGGRFVKLPGFPGEMIDRRLKRDVRYLRERFKIFVTDGYSLDPVHSSNGEHPIGLALDIVPDRASGGTWRRISRLASWAEPKQNRPRAPFRWVGYDGDAGHGRGHHLHLSYSHSPTRFNKPARTVWSIKCPRVPTKTEPSEPDGGGGGGSTGGIDAARSDLERVHRETGGIGLP